MLKFLVTNFNAVYQSKSNLRTLFNVADLISTSKLQNYIILWNSSYSQSETCKIKVLNRLSRIWKHQDWDSPAYSGRLEYICWNSLQIPIPVNWCTIWGYWHFRLDLWYGTHHNTHVRYLWLRSHHRFYRIFFCSCVYMYVYGMRYLKSRSTWARRV